MVVETVSPERTFVSVYTNSKNTIGSSTYAYSHTLSVIMINTSLRSVMIACV